MYSTRWIVGDFAVMDRNTVSATGLKTHFLNAVIFIIVIIQLPASEGVDKCPEGFKDIKTPEELYCYSEKKNSEPQSDKFVNCYGNLFSYSMYTKLKLPKPANLIWADYRTLYPGGIFVDWSYTETTGNLLNTSYDLVQRDSDVNLDEMLCVALDPATNLAMVRCDGNYYRYCIVKPGPISHDIDSVKLTVTVKSRTEINLFVHYTKPRHDQKLEQAKIICFTDSLLYYPQRMPLKKVSNEDLLDVYKISPRDPGYYWCTHTDANFHKSESNNVLYVDEYNSKYVYAVKIIANESYELNDKQIKDLLVETWVPELIEYMQYSKIYTELDSQEDYNNMTVINLKKSAPLDLDLPKFVVMDKKIKRLYLDSKTALFHVEMDTEVSAIKPGQWTNIFIAYMKPVYYCDNEKKLKLGDNHTDSECTFYECIGNYNEGVEIASSSLGPDRCTPQNRLDIAIDEIEEVLNSTGALTTSNVGKMLKRVDDILSLGELHIKGNFLRLLDDLGTRMDLNGTNFEYSIHKNIALVVADAQPDWPVKGLQVMDTGSGAYFTNDTFSILSENTATWSNVTSEMEVSLPKSVSFAKRRVSFVLFRDHTAFQGRQDRVTVNSRILSVKVENLTMFSTGEAIDIRMKPMDISKRNQNRSCAYWKFNVDDSGSWSQEGCNFTSASQDGVLDLCSCNHLTHFAEILIRTGFSEEVETALEKISVIGCCASIFSLLLVGLTAALFRSWRRDYSNKIWLQLCTSILILSVSFLVVVYARFEEAKLLCMLTGIAVHYSVLSSFCWMLVAAIISFRKLVLVFSQDPSHKLLRASVFAWGTPILIVGILLAVAPHSYGEYDVKTPSGAFCYPTGLPLWLTVYAPITLILLANGTMFVLIFRSAFGKKGPSSNRNQKGVNSAFRCASISFLLGFLFGLPWLFGIFSFNVVFAFLFTILATFQGFILFFLFVGNKKSRDLWFAKLKIKKTTVPGLTSTDRSNVPLNKVERTQPKKNLTQSSFLANSTS